jgi:hypothetical protein
MDEGYPAITAHVGAGFDERDCDGESSTILNPCQDYPIELTKVRLEVCSSNDQICASAGSVDHTSTLADLGNLEFD